MSEKQLRKRYELSVLLIEDYLPLQEKIASLLRDYFSTVEVASNGQEGWECYEAYYEAHHRYYDLVMTDFEMPKRNGIELIKKIKKEHHKQNFIVISAHQKPQHLIEFINLGVIHFLPKPIRPQELLAVFEKVSEKLMCASENELKIGQGLTYNTKLKSVRQDDMEVGLSKYDLLLLEVLISTQGAVCTNETILSHFYLYDEDIKEENIRNMVNRLRVKIPLIMIENIYAVGYRLQSF